MANLSNAIKALDSISGVKASKKKVNNSSADKIAKELQNKLKKDFDVSYTGYEEYGESIFLFKFKGSADLSSYIKANVGPGMDAKDFFDTYFVRWGTIKGIKVKGKEAFVNVEL